MAFPDDFDNLPEVIDRHVDPITGGWVPGTKWEAAVTNPWVDAINRIQQNIGLSAQGTHESISERLDNIGGGGGVSSHQDLTDIQGGTTDEYYHLTEAQVEKLDAITDEGDKTITGNLGVGVVPEHRLDVANTANFRGTINLAKTESSTVGVINQNSGRLFHTYSHPTGDTAVPLGRNICIGGEAGNFTMGSTATLTSHGSSNVYVGYRAGRGTTIGYGNVAIGSNALRDVTTGYYNVAIGEQACILTTTGYGNTAVGLQAGYAISSGYSTTAIGYQALRYATTGYYNSALGYRSLFNVTTGYDNVAIGGRECAEKLTTQIRHTHVGTYAGRYLASGNSTTSLGYRAGAFLADGTTQLTSAANSLFLGADTKSAADSQTNEIVIGYGAIGNGSNTVTLGNTSITKTVLRGKIFFSGITEASSRTASNNYIEVDVNGTLYYLQLFT